MSRRRRLARAALIVMAVAGGAAGGFVALGLLGLWVWSREAPENPYDASWHAPSPGSLDAHDRRDWACVLNAHLHALRVVPSWPDGWCRACRRRPAAGGAS